jgi:hypothetical protein
MGKLLVAVVGAGAVAVGLAIAGALFDYRIEDPEDHPDYEETHDS